MLSLTIRNLKLNKLGMRSFSKELSEIKKIVVIGSGLMGSGITQVSAQACYQVTMVDTDSKANEKGLLNIKTSLGRIAKKKYADDENSQNKIVENVMRYISISTDAEEAVQNADLVIEAIVENINIKKDLFGKLDKKAPKDAIFCSNTSSLSIKEMATSTNRSNLFAGLHFFSPVPQMKLVEIIKTDNTDQGVITFLTKFIKAIGKSPVNCKDTPGFVVNRLLVPYLAEAIRLAERGDSSVSDIDTAMKLGAGYPMGPFELLDFIGLDVVKNILEGWKNDSHFNDIKGLVAPSKLLDELISKNHLGRKTGQGFYNYKNDSKL